MHGVGMGGLDRCRIKTSSNFSSSESNFTLVDSKIKGAN
jgi:hypothetical protein